MTESDPILAELRAFQESLIERTNSLEENSARLERFLIEVSSLEGIIAELQSEIAETHDLIFVEKMEVRIGVLTFYITQVRGDAQKWGRENIELLNKMRKEYDLDIWWIFD